MGIWPTSKTIRSIFSIVKNCDFSPPLPIFVGDLVFHHDAVGGFRAIPKRRLRLRHRVHDPKTLDVIEIVEHQPRNCDGMQFRFITGYVFQRITGDLAFQLKGNCSFISRGNSP